MKKKINPSSAELSMRKSSKFGFDTTNNQMKNFFALDI